MPSSSGRLTRVAIAAAVVLCAVPLHAQSYTATSGGNVRLSNQARFDQWQYDKASNEEYFPAGANTAGSVATSSGSRSLELRVDRTEGWGSVWGSSTGSFSASAGAGLLRVNASGNAASYAAGAFPAYGSFNASAVADAFGAFSDVGTFYLTGYAPGTTATITAFIRTNGLLSTTGISTFDKRWYGRTTIAVRADIGSFRERLEREYTIDAYGITGTPFTDEGFFVSSTITLGAATSLKMQATAHIEVGTGAMCDYSCELVKSEADASSDFSHTFEWGGITSLSIGGVQQNLANLRVESASGFDYVHGVPGAITTVPEPSSLALVAVALAAMALGLRLGYRRST